MTAPGGRLTPQQFEEIKRAALNRLPVLLGRWLPKGRTECGEWVALNPTRVDRHLGSFRVNLKSGKWADFADDAKGGDAIDLAAYLHKLDRVEAARLLAGMLGIEIVASPKSSTTKDGTTRKSAAASYPNTTTRKGPR